MKKLFEEPTLDVIELYAVDVITCSNPDWSDETETEWGN